MSRPSSPRSCPRVGGPSIALRTALCLAAVLISVAVAAPDDPKDGPLPPWERRRREMQDRQGGLPESVLRAQSSEAVTVPGLDDAAKAAFAAAEAEARPLLAEAYRHEGKKLIVPDTFKTVQAAIDAAAKGDTVVVRAGTYRELLTMKDGVKLVSDDAEGGDELVAVEGARLQLPRRTLRTILDGSGTEPSSHGMIDFVPGSGRRTVVDGFTIRSLPPQNHHIPNHAHGLNVRGASPVITNCLIEKNGSTGIGNHVVFADQKTPMPERDLRYANVRHEASALIYRNIIRDSLGLGVGCNHYATPFVLGNEVFGNDDSTLGDEPTPAIGAKHGARPTIVGNVVHDNPGGGILASVGEPQGAQAIDRRTAPIVRANLVFANGEKMPGISCSGSGTEEQPVQIVGNRIYDAGAVGIGVSDKIVAVVTGNIVARSTGMGIAVNDSVVAELSENGVAAPGGAGIAVVRGAAVGKMEGNRVDDAPGPRFVLHEGTVGEPQERGTPPGASDGE